MSGVPWQLRRIAILGLIQNTALSGLEAFVLSDRPNLLFDAASTHVCRRALRGKACIWNSQGEVVSSLSNVQVLHEWQLVPTAIELRVRRLK